MNQIDIFEHHPLSHRHDPSTSKEAEQRMEESGKLTSNQSKVAWLVARYPDKTASELTKAAAEHFGTELGETFDKALIEVRRRLSSMRDIHVTADQDNPRIGLLKGKEMTWRIKS